MASVWVPSFFHTKINFFFDQPFVSTTWLAVMYHFHTLAKLHCYDEKNSIKEKKKMRIGEVVHGHGHDRLSSLIYASHFDN